MSLLFPRIAVITMAVAGGSAVAADKYIVPAAELDFVQHSNPLLLANGNSASGYLGSVEGVFGISNRLSVTELRPRIEYQSYSNRAELRHLNQYLDLNSRYASLRSEWQLVANYSRENSYTAQRTAAVYDQFDPNDPTVDATGRISVTPETYTRTQVRPNFVYHLTQRLATEINASFQKVDFSSNVPNADTVDYQDLLTVASLFWAVRPKTRLGTGYYNARYKADDHSDVTTGRGVSFNIEHNWSQKFTGTAAANVERTKVDRVGVAQDDTSNSWALSVGVVRQGQTGNLRLNAGRIFSPSSGGARSTVDQIRVQYYQQFKPLWAYTAALRAIRNREQGVVAGRNDRDYATATVQLNHELTRTWFLTGNYSYTRQKYANSGNAAKDNSFVVGIGYRGLDPQR
jgi:hypothetical protein